MLAENAIDLSDGEMHDCLSAGELSAEKMDTVTIFVMLHLSEI